MAKSFCITIFVALFFILSATVLIHGETPEQQSETRSKTRSKLSSAIRKKKVAKVKVEAIPTVPPTTFSNDENPPSPMPTIESEAGFSEESATISTTAGTTSTVAAVEKVKRRQRPTGRPPTPAGCGECDPEECPNVNDKNCLNGLVLDRCGCCNTCGSLEGNRCFNATLNLPYNPEVGICGPQLDCVLRNDLDPLEPREALCECRDKRIVCGSDGQTYLSPCKLSEAAHTNSRLAVQAWAPCISAPIVTTGPENATVPQGEDVSLSCEVRGFPEAILHWEFIPEATQSGPSTVSKILPGDDAGVVIVVRGGPEKLMSTSWVQLISVSPKNQGTYLCVAHNKEGRSTASAEIRVYKNPDDDDE